VVALETALRNRYIADIDSLIKDGGARHRLEEIRARLGLHFPFEAFLLKKLFSRPSREFPGTALPCNPAPPARQVCGWLSHRELWRNLGRHTNSEQAFKESFLYSYL